MSGEWGPTAQAFNNSLQAAQQNQLQRAQLEQQHELANKQLEVEKSRVELDRERVGLLKSQDERAKQEADFVAGDRKTSQQAEQVAAQRSRGKKVDMLGKALGVFGGETGKKMAGGLVPEASVAEYRADQLQQQERAQALDLEAKRAQIQDLKSRPEREAAEQRFRGELQRGMQDFQAGQSSADRRAQIYLRMMDNGFASGRMKQQAQIDRDARDRVFLQNTLGNYIQNQQQAQNSLAANAANFAFQAYNAATVISPKELADIEAFLSSTGEANPRDKAMEYTSALKASVATDLANALEAAETGNQGALKGIMDRMSKIQGAAGDIGPDDLGAQFKVLLEAFPEIAGGESPVGKMADNIRAGAARPLTQRGDGDFKPTRLDTPEQSQIYSRVASTLSNDKERTVLENIVASTKSPREVAKKLNSSDSVRGYFAVDGTEVRKIPTHPKEVLYLHQYKGMGDSENEKKSANKGVKSGKVIYDYVLKKHKEDINRIFEAAQKEDFIPETTSMQTFLEDQDLFQGVMLKLWGKQFGEGVEPISIEQYSAPPPLTKKGN